jgi:serine/threonine protein phosphatase PrpC
MSFCERSGRLKCRAEILEAEMIDSNNIVIYGKDYETPNEIHCQVIANAKIGLGMSVGTTSKSNEDCLGVSILEEDVLLAIADGHWGREASELAIQKGMELFRSADYLPKENEIRARFYALFEQINRELFEMAMANPGASAPETTLIVCHLKEIGSEKYLYWSSFGDSFLFILRGDELIQLNSLNAYWLGMLSRLAENSQTRQLVLKSLFGESRYVGVADGLETGVEKLQPGDLIFLCTDGLIGSDEKVPESISQNIKRILTDIVPLDQKINSLIKSALERGEKDNVACIIAQID